MSATVTETLAVSSTSGSGYSGQTSETGALAQTIDTAFAAGSTDVLFTIAFSHTTLQKIWIRADQNMTIKVNSSTSPSQTISLIAGRPFRWSASEGYFSNPIVADVTALYITCTSASKLQGVVLN